MTTRAAQVVSAPAGGGMDQHVKPEPVSIIVPAYREAENLPVLADRLFAALEKAGIPGELIIVDDDSGDGTEAAAETLAQSQAVRLIIRRGERGLSSAVVRGFEAARHDILVCMDADLSHPPESVPDIIEPIARKEADFCIGSRYSGGGQTAEDWGLLRRLNSGVATLLARPLTPVRDPMAGFFCLRRETLEAARNAGLSPIGYKIGLEILIKARCRRVIERPIHFSDRLHGKSKLTLRQQLEYLLHLSRLYRFRWPALLPLAGATAAILAGLAAWRLLAP